MTRQKSTDAFADASGSTPHKKANENQPKKSEQGEPRGQQHQPDRQTSVIQQQLQQLQT